MMLKELEELSKTTEDSQRTDHGLWQNINTIFEFELSAVFWMNFCLLLIILGKAD